MIPFVERNHAVHRRRSIEVPESLVLAMVVDKPLTLNGATHGLVARSLRVERLQAPAAYPLEALGDAREMDWLRERESAKGVIV